jgi:hydroxyacylglutathione hydrolase
MLKKQDLSIGQLETNCYLVWEEKSKSAAIIDPAEEGAEIAQIIQEKKLKPEVIILSHGHFDHCLGAMDLKLVFKIPIALDFKDLFLIKRLKSSAEYWLREKTDFLAIEKPDINLEDMKTIKLGEEKLIIIPTPGHTPGSICLYNQRMGWLFSGDTLFKDLRGRTDTSYGSTEQVHKSICQLMKLPKETKVFPGHGEQTTIGEEFPRRGKHCQQN